MIRKPIVAGSFYPEEKTILSQTVEQLLKQASLIEKDNNLKILISPHAGIVYSGETAAAGFKQIKKNAYKKIILLGASHFHNFPHCAVFTQGSWQTPLGDIQTDNEMIKNLTDGNLIIKDHAPHLQEHSLEMQIIFLQKVLKDFKIIPLLVSEVNNNLLNSLSRKLANLLKRKQILLVVSTDLSHYTSYELSKIVDKKIIKAILSLKREKLEKTIDNLSYKYPQVDTFVCGKEALRVCLQTAENLCIKKFRLFKYLSSGDTGGDLSSVVGYASIGGYL